MTQLIKTENLFVMLNIMKHEGPDCIFLLQYKALYLSFKNIDTRILNVCY